MKAKKEKAMKEQVERELIESNLAEIGVNIKNAEDNKNTTQEMFEEAMSKVSKMSRKQIKRRMKNKRSPFQNWLHNSFKNQKN